MDLIMASDYSGFALKEAVRKHLTAAGHTVADVGQLQPDEKVNYLFGLRRVAEAIRSGACRRGLLFCGTGAGMCIMANKYRGVHCVAVESVYSASRAIMINNANVLAMGGNILGPDNACRMVDAWLEREFLDGFDAERRQWLEALHRETLEFEAELYEQNARPDGGKQA